MDFIERLKAAWYCLISKRFISFYGITDDVGIYCKVGELDELDELLSTGNNYYNEHKHE